MISDPKVGDVVYFENAANWSGIFNTNPIERYIVTALPEPLSRDADNIPVRIKYMKTGEYPYDYRYDTGVWACYLGRDEFLSAVNHANEKAA